MRESANFIFQDVQHLFSASFFHRDGTFKLDNAFSCSSYNLRLGFPTFVLFSQLLRFLKGSQVKECVCAAILFAFRFRLSYTTSLVLSPKKLQRIPFCCASRDQQHDAGCSGLSDKCCFHLEITIFHSLTQKDVFCFKSSAGNLLYVSRYLSRRIVFVFQEAKKVYRGRSDDKSRETKDQTEAVPAVNISSNSIELESDREQSSLDRITRFEHQNLTL